MDRRFIIIGVAAAVLAAVVVVGVVSTGGDDSGSEEISTNLDEKPTIPASDATPPTELQTDDIVTGDGAEAQTGDTITVQYVGVDFTTGAEFDASWEREPFQLTLGDGMVIPGWEEGIPGMKVGGRRVLTIPPDLAYGPAGSPPDIGPNATLVFAIDLLEVS